MFKAYVEGMHWIDVRGEGRVVVVEELSDWECVRVRLARVRLVQSLSCL